MRSRKIRFMISFFMYYSMYAIVAPYFQLYLNGKGFSPAVTGMLLGVWEVTGIVGPIVLGMLADRTSRYRTILLTCTLISVLVPLIMLKIDQLLPVYLMVAVFGFVFKPVMPVIDSMISHGTENPQYDYGHIRVAGSIGFVAVMIVFEITGIFDMPTPAMIAKAVLFFGICYGITLIFLPAVVHQKSEEHEELAESAQHRKARSQRFQDFLQFASIFLRTIPRDYFVLITIVFVGRIGFTSYYSFFSLYLQEELYVENVGLFWMIATAAEILPIMFAGRIIRFTGRFTALSMGFTAMITRMLVYGFSQSIWLMGVMQLLHSMTFGLMHVTCISYVNEHIPKKHKTLAMSLYISISWGLAAFIGSPICGFLIELTGYNGMFRYMALFPASSLLFLITYKIVSLHRGNEIL